MAQINSINGGGSCTVTQGSTLIVAAPGISWAAAKAGFIFTVVGSGIPYFLAVDAALNNSGRWQAYLSAPYLQPSNPAASYALAISFTSVFGLVTFSPGDTELPTMLTRSATQIEAALVAGLNASDSRFDALSPASLESGVSITVGVTDESTYIQAQLNAAVAARKAVVRLDNRQYGILPGVIQVPNHVTLAHASGEASMARQVVNYGAGQPPIDPTSGAQFVMLGGQNGSDTDPAYITLVGVRSALVGASFFDPDNPSSLATPVPKPFAVRVADYGGSVKRIEAINTYRLLDIQGGRVVAEDITGNPLSIGVRCDAAYDFIHLRTTHFVDSFVRGTAMAAWFVANATGHVFYDVDNIVARDLNTFAYRVGLLAGPSPTNQREVHGPYGSVSDSTFDGCFIAFWDYGTRTNYYPFTLNNCTLISSGYGPTGRCYKADGTKFGITQIQGGGMFTDPDVAMPVQISGGTLIRINNVHVLMPAYGATHGFLVDGLAGVDFFGNRFNTKATGGKTIFVSSTNSNGRIKQNSIGGIVDPLEDTASNSPGIELPSPGDPLSGLLFDETGINANTTLTPAAFGHRFVCSGAGPYTVTLPPGAGYAGKSIEFLMDGSLTGLVTLNAGAGSHINGQPTRLLHAGESCVLVTNSADWSKRGGVSVPFLVSVSNGGFTLAQNAFTPLSFPTINADPYGLWNTSTNQFPFPRPGLFSFNASLRLPDTTGTAAVYDYALGINNTAADGPWSVWANTVTGAATNRSMLLATRTVAGVVGVNYLAYYYSQGFTGAAINAQLTIAETCTW